MNVSSLDSVEEPERPVKIFLEIINGRIIKALAASSTILETRRGNLVVTGGSFVHTRCFKIKPLDEKPDRWSCSRVRCPTLPHQCPNRFVQSPIYPGATGRGWPRWSLPKADLVHDREILAEFDEGYIAGEDLEFIKREEKMRVCDWYLIKNAGQSIDITRLGVIDNLVTLYAKKLRSLPPNRTAFRGCRRLGCPL
jgi:hypothetical protein